MTRLVLASTSRYRADVLRRIGVPFDPVAPEVEEVIPAGMTPFSAAAMLARKKALAVSTRPAFRDAIVIGSDQICVAPELEADPTAPTILGKPGRADLAVAQLERLQGRRHRLVTAVAVARLEEVHVAIDVHTLTMHPLTRDEIRYYIASDQPLDCAGSYRLESRGIALFSRIECDPETADESAILGLPLLKTLRLLRERFGWSIFERGDAT